MEGDFFEWLNLTSFIVPRCFMHIYAICMSLLMIGIASAYILHPTGSIFTRFIIFQIMTLAPLLITILTISFLITKLRKLQTSPRPVRTAVFAALSMVFVIPQLLIMGFLIGTCVYMYVTLAYHWMGIHSLILTMIYIQSVIWQSLERIGNHFIVSIVSFGFSFIATHLVHIYWPMAFLDTEAIRVGNLIHIDNPTEFLFAAWLFWIVINVENILYHSRYLGTKASMNS